jgi:hypothetical protein
MTMTMDATAMTPPEDPRVGPHPFVGRSDRWCDLPGCDRPDRNPIHQYPDGLSLGDLKASEFYALLEAAKSVARFADTGKIIGTPATANSWAALQLLEQALTKLGHSQHAQRPSERVMAEVARIRRDDPALFTALTEAGEIQVRDPDPCPGCGAHSLVPCEPGCSVGGVMARYQAEGR